MVTVTNCHTYARPVGKKLFVEDYCPRVLEPIQTRIFQRLFSGDGLCSPRVTADRAGPMDDPSIQAFYTLVINATLITKNRVLPS
jgi:hypothetical protein